MKAKKAFIHIGGGYLQLPGIKHLKKIGVHLVVTDKNDAAPGVNFADQYEKIDGTDIESFIILGKKISQNYNLIGAFTSSDYGIMSVAALAEEFSFPGVSKHSAQISLNKGESRRIWKQNGIPISIGYQIENLNDLNGVLNLIESPLIVKPTDSCGSQGIRSAQNIDELSEAFIKAKEISKNVIIEQLISGHHCDVNGMFIRGKFYRCGVMDRFFSDPPFHFPIFGIQPSSLTEEQRCEVYNLLESASKLLGIIEGPVKGDVIYTEKGPVLLEVAPRFHGDVSTQIVTPYATGINPVESWLSFLCGEHFDIVSTKNRFAGWRALFSKKIGIIDTITGVNDAFKFAGVKNIYISKKHGDRIVLAQDNKAMCGFLWAISKNADSVLTIMEKAASMINFNVLQGEPGNE